MKKPSDEQQREQLRQRIIGLGEKSLKKSYYPELQKRILELEQANLQLEEEIAERKKSEEQRRKLESQLRQAQKMEAIGSLAGGIAHDFNNILSAIIGYSELASIHSESCDNTGKCPLANDLDGILRSANRAKELVRQILLFSSRQPIKRVPVSLEEIVAETLKMLRALIPTTIKIEHTNDIMDTIISADSTQINQVLMNLGTNAYHAMREQGGMLSFAISEEEILENDVIFSDLNLSPGSYITLTVTDTGCGMNSSTMENIFTPYFSTKKNEGGTGLGLSVAHGIVTQHDGYIFVYSEQGKGSSFHLYFPKLQQKVNSLSYVEDKEIIKGTENLLIVDDEPDLLEIMRVSLENLGYAVTTSNTPTEALNIYSEVPDAFDLLITDMNMPELSGADLIEKIRQITPDLPVILCTGFSEIMNAETAEALGRVQYIMKPVTQRQMNSAIRNLLDG